MTDSKASGLLGIAKRAGRLSLGHDMSEAAIKSGKARLCIVSKDSSQRLKDEMRRLCTENKISFICSEYTMNELGLSTGSKTTAALTVNDDGFARRIEELIGRNNDI